MNLFKPCFQRYLNQSILKQAAKLSYVVADNAPNTAPDLFNEKSLKIWSGESDKTIFDDPAVNYAFRAIHDTYHRNTRLDFTGENEIILGQLQANRESCLYLREVILNEISGQAAYFLSNGVFVPDQIQFAKSMLQNNNLFKGVLNV